MMIAWVASIYRHGHNQLRGWVFASVLLPIIALVLMAVEWYLTQSLNEQDLQYLSVLADCRLYSGSLFAVWQLWSYVFFHNDLWHLCINAFFLIPICMYWERYFGVWFGLCVIALLPISVVMFVLIPTQIPVIGSSALICAMYAAVLLYERGMRAEYMRLLWWGSRISLGRHSVDLLKVFVIYLMLDLGRALYLTYYEVFDWQTLAVYIGNLLLATCAGTSVFTVVQHLRRRLQVPSQEAAADA